MFQSCMLYSQFQSLEINKTNNVCQFSHHHVSCEICIRPIQEIWLTSNLTVDFKNHDITIQNMLGREPKFIEYEPVVSIQSARWDLLTATEQSFHLGVAQGMLVGVSSLEGLEASHDT